MYARPFFASVIDNFNYRELLLFLVRRADARVGARIRSTTDDRHARHGGRQAWLQIEPAFSTLGIDFGDE